MHAHRTWVEISARALTNNIEALRSLLTPEARFCAVVKANAYGHGLKEVTTIARNAEVDAFAVDNIDDALQLRDMNMMMVDVSAVPQPQKEDEVILLGTDGRHRISADDLAKTCQTVSYEIVTRINPLLPRVVV